MTFKTCEFSLPLFKGNFVSFIDIFTQNSDLFSKKKNSIRWGHESRKFIYELSSWSKWPSQIRLNNWGKNLVQINILHVEYVGVVQRVCMVENHSLHPLCFSSAELKYVKIWLFSVITWLCQIKSPVFYFYTFSVTDMWKDHFSIFSNPE